MSEDELRELMDRVREEAARDDAMAIDVEACRRWGRDPLEPLLGAGEEASPIGFFGRDPGRDEVRWMEPLIGAGGRLVRAGVHRALYGEDPAGFEAERLMSRAVFFSNTVPYKPVGNKAWGMRIKRRFRPYIAEYLVDLWRGSDLVTLGNVAFHWFGLGGPREERDRLKAFWARDDRYERSVDVTLESPRTGRSRTLRLHPLPHPSPANATWFKRFPGMLDARLADLAARGVRPLDPERAVS
ncbi:MAG: uracil-DNA glycosylase family protein [Myxococcota bacterium]